MTNPPSDKATHRIELGHRVDGPDGECGEVRDVVIHPLRHVVTHVALGPHHRGQSAVTHLLPIEDLQVSADGHLVTTLSTTDLAALPIMDDVDYFRLGDWPELAGEWDVGITEVLSSPYYQLGWPYSGGGAYNMDSNENDDSLLMTFERVPVGEVEIRRRSVVIDRDNKEVGHVEAFVMDAEELVTHIVIDRGHLWKHQEIAVPVNSATQVVNDKVTLDLSAEQIDQLPSVPYHRRR